jgi:L-amino acid N-acyltransferase YncA
MKVEGTAIGARRAERLADGLGGRVPGFEPDGWCESRKRQKVHASPGRMPAMPIPNPPPPIRLATTDDAARIAEIYAPHVTDRPTSFELVPPDGPVMAGRIAAVLRQWPWLVWDDGGGAVAYAYASAHAERIAYRWSVNVSVYVDAAHQRRGLGRALYLRLFEILRVQGVYSAFAGITLPNASSVGLHAALGFEPIGVFRNAGHKLGAWHDVAWMGLALRQPDGNAAPEPPRPLPELIAEGSAITTPG